MNKAAELRREVMALSQKDRTGELLDLAGQGASWERRVLMLLELGANPNVRTSRGDSALGRACACRDSERVVKALLERGAKVNVADSTGDTPLIWAAYYASTKNCRALLKAGAKVNATNDEGGTALVSALAGARHEPACLEVVPVLLAAGADPSLTAHSGPRAELSCVRLACELGSLPTLERLVAAGAPVDHEALLEVVRLARSKPTLACDLARLLVAHGAKVTEEVRARVAKLEAPAAATLSAALEPKPTKQPAPRTRATKPKRTAEARRQKR